MARGGVAFGCLLVAAMTASAPASPKVPLALSLGFDTQEIVPFEPLRATVRLTNVGEKPVNIGDNVWSSWRFVVTDEDGQAVEYAGALRHAIGCGGGLVIEPGQEWRYDEMLLWNFNEPDRQAQEFVFRRPGKYQVRVRLGPLIESRPVLVTVRELSEAGSGVLNLQRSKSVVRLLMGFADDDREAAVDTLSRLVHQAPESAYADHAHYALGQYFFSRADAWGYAEGPDNVWALTEVQRWAAKRAFEHFSAVSERAERLKARALYEQARMAACMLRRYPEFAGDMSFFELQRRYNATLPVLRQMAYGRRITLPGSDGPDYLSRSLRTFEVLFLPDLRLDRRVVYHFEDFVPKEVVLALISEQSGVPLDADPEFKTARMRTVKLEAKPLREFLLEQTHSGSYWERRGNGYYHLVPERALPPGAIPGLE